MGDTKFDFQKPWRIGDLPEDIRSIMEKEHGLETGVTYVGGVDGDPITEVPHCPYCGIGTYYSHRCRHLVFGYDSTNGEYIGFDPSFKKYVMEVWSKTVSGVEDSPLVEALAEIAKGNVPYPKDLSDSISGLVFREVFDVSGIHGLGCGYADDHLLEICSSTASSPNQ